MQLKQFQMILHVRSKLSLINKTTTLFTNNIVAYFIVTQKSKKLW